MFAPLVLRRAFFKRPGWRQCLIAVIPKEELPGIPAIVADKGPGDKNDVSWIVHGFMIYLVE